MKLFKNTYLSPHPIPQLVSPARNHLLSSPGTTRGPPLSPSHVSRPPSMYPAHKNILGMYWLWPDSLKNLSQRLLEMMGTSTCLNLSDISFLSFWILPQPVTQPSLPTRSSLELGRQIGSIWGWKYILLFLVLSCPVSSWLNQKYQKLTWNVIPSTSIWRRTISNSLVRLSNLECILTFNIFLSKCLAGSPWLLMWSSPSLTCRDVTFSPCKL